jgi:predicted site-specific integrase-resolvase
MKQIKFWFSQTTLAERYQVTPRTIQRWKESGKLPPPTPLPSGRDGWANTTIEEHERARMAGEVA